MVIEKLITQNRINTVGINGSYSCSNFHIGKIIFLTTSTSKTISEWTTSTRRRYHCVRKIHFENRKISRAVFPDRYRVAPP